MLFIFQQTNGNQFANSVRIVSPGSSHPQSDVDWQYGPTFYVQFGLGAASFTYSTLFSMMSVIGCLAGILVTDKIGRRPLMIWGSFGATLCLFIGAGVGVSPNLTTAGVNTVVAMFIMLGFFIKISASNNAFLMG